MTLVGLITWSYYSPQCPLMRRIFQQYMRELRRTMARQGKASCTINILPSEPCKRFGVGDEGDKYFVLDATRVCNYVAHYLAD
jgi:hypothetical protein